MGISSRNDIFCMKKGCFLPQNRSFSRFISSELIPISSEEKGISSELIAITSEIFGINRHFFGINATKKSKYIYIFFSIRACAHACARENFQENIGGKGIGFIHKKKREKKKLRQKEKSKKKTPQCLWSSLYHFRGFTQMVRIPFLSAFGKPPSGSCRD